jgi:hypothetical protein
MSGEIKISPAFEPFLAESGPNDKRDAIVIFRAPEIEGQRVRGRLRALKQRLDYIKARAATQKPVQARLFKDYQKASAKSLPKHSRSPFPQSARAHCLWPRLRSPRRLSRRLSNNPM